MASSQKREAWLNIESGDRSEVGGRTGVDRCRTDEVGVDNGR